MALVERGNYFRIYNEIVFHNKIGNERSNQLFLLVNLERLLLINSEAAVLQLDDESTLIEFLVEPWFESIQNVHRCSNNEFR